jgi:hypothetical protein
MARNGKRPENGQYVPLPYAQLKSNAWRSLSGAAVKLLLELHTRYNGSNNGKLHLSMNEAAEILGMGKATVQRAYVELQEKGFLVLEHPGNWYSRRAHDWRLTTKPSNVTKSKVTATMEWRNWSAQKTKRGSETEPSGQTIIPPQNQKTEAGTATAPVRCNSAQRLGSETEH